MGAVKGNACVDQPNGFGSVGGKMEKLWVRSQDRSKLQLVDSFEIKENKDGTYSINDFNKGKSNRCVRYYRMSHWYSSTNV